MFGDYVLHADTAREAESLALQDLTYWSGTGLDGEIQVDGVTVHDDMTEVQR
jgi:hypothetical protein